jgi:hypothetical protein
MRIERARVARTVGSGPLRRGDVAPCAPTLRAVAGRDEPVRESSRLSARQNATAAAFVKLYVTPGPKNPCWHQACR